MDGISSTPEARIAELELLVEKLRAERKILRVQLREQKDDYVRTLSYMCDVVQKMLDGRKQELLEQVTG